MLSLSAVHVQSAVHVVRTTAVQVATVVQVVKEVHAAMTEAQEVHVATVMTLLSTTTETTSRRCSNLLNNTEKRVAESSHSFFMKLFPIFRELLQNIKTTDNGKNHRMRS